VGSLTSHNPIGLQGLLRALLFLSIHVGFEVLTAVAMKGYNVVTLKVSRRLGRTYRLHLHGLRRDIAACFVSGFLLVLLSEFEVESGMFIRNVGLPFS
jgi:hypothetical protein